jgi:hypothetical protein
MRHDDVWFPVDSPPVGAAAGFLEAARAAAVGWQPIGITPADTAAMAELDGFLSLSATGRLAPPV